MIEAESKYDGSLERCFGSNMTCMHIYLADNQMYRNEGRSTATEARREKQLIDNK